MDEAPLPRRRGRPPKSARTLADTRTALIRIGIEILTEQGFLSTGIDQFLRRHHIPKGSFYHYFPSKEAFGYAVVDHYAAYFARKLDHWLLDETTLPLQRLAYFVADAKAGMTRHGFRRGCLIGNLGQEFGANHAGFRERIDGTLLDWQTRVTACLALAKEHGELSADADCTRLARLFWIGWEGAVLRAKLVCSGEPIDLFAEYFFSTLPR